jgi:hypothetical protein
MAPATWKLSTLQTLSELGCASESAKKSRLIKTKESKNISHQTVTIVLLFKMYILVLKSALDYLKGF